MAKKRSSKRKKKKMTDSGFRRFMTVAAVLLVFLLLFSMTPVGKQFYEDLKNGEFSAVSVGSIQLGQGSAGTDKTGSSTEKHENASVNIAEDGNNIRFDFVDVGQADCTLVTTPSGESILIDTGLSGTTPDVLSFLEDRGVDGIEYLVLTHPHSDHIGGAAEILTVYDVKNILMPAAAGSGATFEKLLSRIELEKKDGCKVYRAQVGDTYTVDGCKMEIFGPVQIDEEEPNNSSIVMTVEYGDFTALFSGDAEAVAEKAVLALEPDIDCELMKIGHHGSSTSSTDEFLDAASPLLGIISCGKNNSYGHPHSSVIEALEDRNVEYYITAENGSISVISDGNAYNVKTER